MKQFLEKYGVKSLLLKISFIFIAIAITISFSYYTALKNGLANRSKVAIETVQNNNQATNESVINQTSTDVVSETATEVQEKQSTEETSSTAVSETSAEDTRIAQEQSAAPISGISELPAANSTTVSTQTNETSVEGVVNSLNLQQVMNQSIEVSSESDLLENVVSQILNGTQEVYYYYPGNYQANLFTKLLTYESTQNPIKDKEYLLWMLNYKTTQEIDYYTGSGGVSFSIIKLNLVYKVTPDMESQVDAKVNQIIAACNEGTVVQRIKKVYDYVMTTITYDDDLVNHTVYDALIRQDAVCDAYSLSMYRILSEMGIPCKFVASKSHAWNIVQIDGVWYNLDATWDDVESGEYSYAWFLKSNMEFPYHVRADGYTYSECIMSATSYQWQ